MAGKIEIRRRNRVWFAWCNPCQDAWHDAFVRNLPREASSSAIVIEQTHAEAIAWADQHLREVHLPPGANGGTSLRRFVDVELGVGRLTSLDDVARMGEG